MKGFPTWGADAHDLVKSRAGEEDVGAFANACAVVPGMAHLVCQFDPNVAHTDHRGRRVCASLVLREARKRHREPRWMPHAASAEAEAQEEGTFDRSTMKLTEGRVDPVTRSN